MPRRTHHSPRLQEDVSARGNSPPALGDVGQVRAQPKPLMLRFLGIPRISQRGIGL